jgi:hypothetical protein
VGGALFVDVEEVETAEMGEEAEDPEFGEELGGKGEVVVSIAADALVGVGVPELACGLETDTPELELVAADEGDLAPGLDDDDDALVPGFA